MNEQEEIIECLQALELREGSHENLSAICAAIYEPMGGWTQGACEGLRHRLVRLLSGVQMPARVGELITGELRTGGIYRFPSNKRVFTEEELTAIADRIDAAHEEALREAYTKGREDGMAMANAKDAQAEYLRGRNDGYDEGYDAGFASADDWCAQHEDAMAEHGWVRLPVDGEAPCKQLGEWIEKRGLITGPLDHDGELWHKGDMSASPWGEIESIVFDGQCWQVCGYDTSAPWLPADSLLHYHAPTVEDVLRDFGIDWECSADGEDKTAVLKEYAAKLQLRGDAE